jgi:hypothetical protein
MTRLSRFSSLVSPWFLAGACAQLIGLGDYETGKESTAKGGEGGEGDTTSGGTRATGGVVGTGGAGVKTGGIGGDAGDGAGGGVSTGGRPTRGGAGGDSGAGDAGGEPGQGGVNSTGGKATGGANTGGTDTGGTDTGGTSTGGTSTGGTGGLPPTCTEITLGELALGDFNDTSNPSLGYYVLDMSPSLGSSVTDFFEMEFWDGGSYNGADTGTFQLGAGTSRDSNYVSCARCLVVYTDKGDAGEKRFFQRSGSITVEPSSQHMVARPNLTITDLTLEEVTWDDDLLISMPVVGGECLHLESATVFVPPAWSCDPVWYTDSTCDCGCDAFDPVCNDSTESACDYCWCNDVDGNCSNNEISPNMNQFCN